MLVSPNGPAYGSRPKLVVMKVLCKLRWRKIRHPLAFSHSVFLFIHSLYSCPCFCLTVYFLHRRLSYPSLSPFIISSLLPLLSFLYLCHFPSFTPSFCHHAILSLHLSLFLCLYLCILTKWNCLLSAVSKLFCLLLFCSLCQELLSQFPSLLISL